MFPSESKSESKIGNESGNEVIEVEGHCQPNLWKI